MMHIFLQIWTLQIFSYVTCNFTEVLIKLSDFSLLSDIFKISFEGAYLHDLTNICQ